MRPSFAERVDGRFHHVGRRVKIRLSDLQMDDAPALALQRPCLAQDFKGGLGAQPRHAPGRQ